MLSIFKIPLTLSIDYKQAAKSSNWIKAMQLAYDCLLKKKKKTSSWTLVLFNHAYNKVGCKWPVRIKHHPDGSIGR